MTIIGLAGYARSGKDTVGKIMVDEWDFTRTAFADPLKAMADALDPIVDVDIFTPPMTERLRQWLWGLQSRSAVRVRLSKLIAEVGREEAKAHPEVRRFYQRLGTEAGREILGNDIWVDTTMSKVLEQPRQDWVITDVRFTNEADAIRQHGGLIWRVVREGTGPINGHSSESSMDDYPVDLVIENNDTIDALVERVHDAVHDVRKQAVSAEAVRQALQVRGRVQAPPSKTLRIVDNCSEPAPRAKPSS